jgi:hypothetical protein
MSGFMLVNQSPPSFDWASNSLQSSANSPYQLRNDLYTTPVYISTTGVSPSVFFNQRGTWTYSFVKTGATTGTSTGTAVAGASGTAFSDTKVGGALTQTNYALTITDGATGIKKLFNNLVVWGAI